MHQHPHSSTKPTTEKKHRPSYWRRQLNRIASTCQSISHLSYSFTDSLHSSSPSTHSQPLHDDLSPHRKRILGSVPDRWPMYSNDPQDYLLTHQIGFGASSIVRLAHFKPRAGELCAVKVIDIDRLSPKQIEYLRSETILMSLAKHPNVLRVRGEWIQDSSLCISMRLMKAGSIADLIQYRYQDGFSEQVIATVLIQAIAGLNYLHSNDWIHRDLKAANLLLDNDGTVLIADFGVCLDRNLQTSNRQQDDLDCTRLPSPILPSPRPPLRARLPSFVGTALFMAPEVVTRQPYDDRVDIWSFGITALEMAIGKPPHATHTPALALIKTVQDPSPTLNRKPSGSPHRYSKKFQKFIDHCLMKNPSERPSAQEILLKEKFFRQARNKSFLVHSILNHHLPPLELRQERRVFVHPEESTSPTHVNHHHTPQASNPLPPPPLSSPHQTQKITNPSSIQDGSSQLDPSLCCPWNFDPDSPSTRSLHFPEHITHP